MFSRDLETLRVDGYLILLTHGGISSTDEAWGIPVGEKGPPESGNVLLQVCCWAEDSANGVPLDAEPTHDRRGEKPEN